MGKNNGFFDSLMKDINMWGAVQASKDSKGKIDPYKAAGMAWGSGKIKSFEDIMRLGAVLGSQDAFDEDSE